MDSTVQYHCHLGYSTAGFPRAKCLAIDGQASWYGPDISCERKKFLGIFAIQVILIILFIARSCGQPTDPG